MPFSTVVAPVYVSTTMHKSSSCSTSLPAFIFCIFDDNYLNGCEVVMGVHLLCLFALAFLLLQPLFLKLFFISNFPLSSVTSFMSFKILTSITLLCHHFLVLQLVLKYNFDLFQCMFFCKCTEILFEYRNILLCKIMHAIKNKYIFEDLGMPKQF